MAVQFGITRDAGTYGVIQSYETSDTSEIAEYADADGDTAGYNPYNRQIELTAEMVYESTTVPPASGAVIAMDGPVTGDTNNWVVTDVKDGETNTDYRKVTLTAKRWVTNTIPA